MKNIHQNLNEPDLHYDKYKCWGIKIIPKKIEVKPDTTEEEFAFIRRNYGSFSNYLTFHGIKHVKCEIKDFQ